MEKVISSSIGIPATVTDEPQHEEHLNMTLLGDSLSLRENYLAVSDDAGELLRDTQLEDDIKRLTEEAHQIIKSGNINERKELLRKLKDASGKYHRQINLAVNISSGILVKYQIRLGSIYKFQKDILRKISPEKKWIEWFGETYGADKLRSAQDFMKLADIPHIIRYAVLGRSRLMEIIRVLPPCDRTDDPIRDFLNKYNIVFDPEADVALEDWRANVDAAAAMERIRTVERKNNLSLPLTFEQVKHLVDNGVAIDNKLIKDICTLHQNNGNIPNFLENTILGKQKYPIQIERAEKLESVHVLVKKIANLVSFYMEDKVGRSDIDVDVISELRRKIEELEALCQVEGDSAENQEPISESQAAI